MEMNEYPKHLVNNIIKQELQNKNRSNEVKPDNRKSHKMQVMLSYGDTKGSKLIIYQINYQSDMDISRYKVILKV